MKNVRKICIIYRLGRNDKSNMNKDNLINKIIKNIKEQEKNINKANEIDRKHYKMKINIQKLIQISNKMKDKDIGKFTDKNLIIIHNGNPYITYILAIKAICSNTNLDICVNETMLGTNFIIVKIIKEVLKELKIQIHLEVLRNLDIEELNSNESQIKNDTNKKIIILQDKSEYSRLLKEKIPNVYYYPIYNICLYIDNEEFEEIKQYIIKYCDENFIEVEIYDADDIEDAIEQIEADNEGEYVLILTKEKIKEKAKIDININTNILSDLEERLIEKEIR